MGLDVDGVSSDPQSAWAVLDARDIDHANLHGHADLLGGETDAVRVVHRLQHVLSKCPDPGVDFFNPSSLGAQSGMTVLDNFQNHEVTRILRCATA